uniref:SH2 domain-containing protein n=1 Tax=Elaeophora elaphi TaxID=1147741 RepID=A0A0R3S323_9BILA
MSLIATVMPTYDIPRPSQEAVLRLESWYHGLLTRFRSECLVRSEGDFLVRDSISFKGDFVLTVFWNGHAVHFQINKDPSPSINSYNCLFKVTGLQFEEEQFENVPDLIIFYQTHHKPITRNSGCIIKNPVPNTTVSVTRNIEPQLEIDQNYMKILRPQILKSGQERSLTKKVLLNETRKQFQLKTAQPPSSTSPVPSYGKPHLPLSDLLSRPLPKPIQSPAEEDQDEYSEIDYEAIEETTATLVAPKEILAIRENEVISASTSRLSHLQQNHKLSLTSLNSICNEQTPSSNTLLPTYASCLDISKLHWRMPRSDSFPALPKRKVSCPIRDSGCVMDSSDYDQPRARTTMSTSIAIDLRNYWSPFIELNNKAQTEQLLERFKQLLLTKKPESCAQLITAEDYRLLRFGRNIQVAFKNVAKFERLNGLLLILLPHGQDMRNDLLERNRSLHYLCVLSILHEAQSAQRCAVYDAWVQITRALFYQFEYSRTLQQELESVARKLHRCEPLPLNCPQINIPFMQPLLSILSNDLSPPDNTDNNTTWATEVGNRKVSDNLWKWLQEGRHWIKQAVQLGANNLNLCSEKLSDGDNFLSTEFSLKLLFGSKDFSMDTERRRYDHLAAMACALKKRCSLNC